MYISRHVKLLLFLPDFNENFNHLTDFKKKTLNYRIPEIDSVIDELFHADEKTDVTKLVVTSAILLKASKQSWAG